MSAEAPGKVFPFFQLPPEIREMIYDQALPPRKRLSIPYEDVLAYAVKIAAGNLLLLNHQFSQEYMARATRLACLVYEIRDNLEYTLPKLPRSLRYISRLEVVCILQTGGFDRFDVSDEQIHGMLRDGVEGCCNGIVDILENINRRLILSTISFAVYGQATKFLRQAVAASKERFTDAKGFTAMEVFLTDTDRTLEPRVHWTFCTRDKLFMEYNATTDELEQVASFGKCIGSAESGINQVDASEVESEAGQGTSSNALLSER